MDPDARTAIVHAWNERDRARAILPADNAIIESTSAIRESIVLRVNANLDRDLFHACAMLGRMIATQGGSPTLAASTIDGAREALDAEPNASWIAPSRAATLEGFAAARSEMARAEAFARWDYKRCTVRIDDTTIAIAAGIEDDDGEAVSAWAGRIANACAKDNAKRALISGSEKARAALLDALSIAGIEVITKFPASQKGLFSWLKS